MSAVFSTLSNFLTPFSLFAISYPALVISEASAFYPGSAFFKLASSTAFVWRSLTQPNTFLIPSTPSFYITLSLACGWIGDLCLIPSRKSYYTPDGGHDGDSVWFKLGMLAFMLNHAGYVVAFLRDIRELGGSSSSTNWLIFGATFAFCIIMGDVTGMPVPWKKQAEAQPTIASPRLPTIHTKGPIVKDPSEINEDVPSEPLANSISSDNIDILSLKSRIERRPSLHGRTDSGVTDLSISIPATPKGSGSPTIITPLLSPKSMPTKESFHASLIPKMAVPDDMKPLIIIYQVIISTMAASAAGTRGLGSARFWGAFLFMVSDVMVAWDTFGVKKATEDVKKIPSQADEKPRREGWQGRSFGWLLYFGGQYALAAYGAQ